MAIRGVGVGAAATLDVPRQIREPWVGARLNHLRLELEVKFNGLMWQWIYDPKVGALNGLLFSIGIISEYQGWLSQPIYAQLRHAVDRDEVQGVHPQGDRRRDQNDEVLTCLSVDSKDEVNRIVDTAPGAGATEARAPMNHGFMFGRSFRDLDGHIWEIIWMDPSHVGK